MIIPIQFGLCRNHSTIYAILDNRTESYQSIDDKLFSALILLDTKKAFDSVCHKIPIKKLEIYGIRAVTNKLLHSYEHIEMEAQDFFEFLTNMIDKLTIHCYIAKC